MEDNLKLKDKIYDILYDSPNEDIPFSIQILYPNF